MLENKSLPHSAELEEGVLGTIINNNEYLMDCISVLGEEDFYSSSSKILYKKIKQLVSKGITFDIVTILEKMTKEERDTVGITNATRISGNILLKEMFSEYVKTIKEYSNRRKMIKESNLLMTKAYDTSVDFGSALDGFMKVTGNFENATDTETIFDTQGALESTLNLIEKKYSNPNKLNGISTGIKNIDRAMLGLTPGDLVILAGRPSMGKTVMALNIANNINKNEKVLIFSLEMVKEKLFNRLLSARSRVNSRNILSGSLTEQDFMKISKASNALFQKNNIFVDDRPNLTIEEIKRTAKRQKLQHGLSVVFVDHIGIMADSFKGSRNEVIGHITKELKALAKELNVCVIALCQLNRSVETRNEQTAKAKRDYTPGLSDLRDSGNIEQDADIVMFVYRDEYYSRQGMKLEEPELNGTIQLFIAKGRDIGIGKTTLDYNENYQLITERNF